MEEHPNGRCTMAPWVATWEELGFSGIEETAPVIEDGATAFDKLTDDKQLKVLGPAKYTAYKSGDIKLKDLVGRKYSNKWGAMNYEKSLNQLGLDRSKLLKEYMKNPVPELIKKEQAAIEITKIHNVTGGATFSLRHGNMANKPYRSVSIFPDITHTIPGKEIDAKTIKNFVSRYEGLAKEINIAIGTWYNEGDGRTYLDFSVLIEDLGTAKNLAKKYNQIGIFNLENMEYIETGGSGGIINNLPPINQRLKDLLP